MYSFTTFVGAALTLAIVFLTMHLVKGRLVRNYGIALGLFRLNVYVATFCFVSMFLPQVRWGIGLFFCILNLIAARGWFSRRKDPKFMGCILPKN